MILPITFGISVIASLIFLFATVIFFKLRWYEDHRIKHISTVFGLGLIAMTVFLIVLSIELLNSWFLNNEKIIDLLSLAEIISSTAVAVFIISAMMILKHKEEKVNL